MWKQYLRSGLYLKPAVISQDRHCKCVQVIDEADRMMDEVKQDWLTQVEKAVYSSDPDSDWSMGSVSRNIGSSHYSSFRNLPRPVTAKKWVLVHLNAEPNERERQKL